MPKFKVLPEATDRPKFLKFAKQIKAVTRDPLEEFVDALRRGDSTAAMYYKAVLEKRIIFLEASRRRHYLR